VSACPVCRIWIVKDTDNYCSFCGNRFSALHLSMTPSRFRHDDLPPAATLTMENQSQGEVRIDRCFSEERWIAVELDCRLPLVLGPHQKKSFKVTVETQDAEEEYAVGRVCVDSTLDLNRRKSLSKCCQLPTLRLILESMSSFWTTETPKRHSPQLGSAPVF